MTVGLMMIVKNEEKVLPRLAESLKGKIDRWTVVDTGSEDETVEVAKKVFDTSGEVLRTEWKGFGPSRQVALEAADGKTDWLLWLDADETVEGEIFPALLQQADIDAIEVEERYGNLRYWKPYLIRSGRGWQWKGRAHEALVKDGARIEKTDSFHVLHHADGGSRANKYERDLELLEQDWLDDPNARTTFYLARTYEDGGNVEEAKRWYRTRLSMGGWEEEVFYSLYRLGILTEGDEGCGVLWRAWGMRPHRPEPLLALAERYRRTDNFQLAWLAAFTALSCHQHLASDLFYDADSPWKIRYELSISAWYTDHRDLGRIHLNHLLALDLPEPYKTSTRQNAAFYQMD